MDRHPAVIPAALDSICAELRALTDRLDESALRRAAEDALHIELDSALFDGYRFPVPLECGCKVRLEDDWQPGDTIRHTKRVWDLCERHEALGCEP